MDKKYLLETWREIAYNQQQTQEQYDQFWGAYFAQEVEVYKDLLKNHGTVVSGTVEELAKFLLWLVSLTELTKASRHQTT